MPESFFCDHGNLFWFFPWATLITPGLRGIVNYWSQDFVSNFQPGISLRNHWVVRLFQVVVVFGWTLGRLLTNCLAVRHAGFFPHQLQWSYLSTFGRNCLPVNSAENFICANQCCIYTHVCLFLRLRCTCICIFHVTGGTAVPSQMFTRGKHPRAAEFPMGMKTSCFQAVSPAEMLMSRIALPMKSWDEQRFRKPKMLSACETAGR